MLDPKCRLCSSTCTLISLFNGKSRKNRDYIRKLVENTTGIKFEKDDTFKFICYSCTVQVYNFYVFKIRSTENERILKAHIRKDDISTPKKFQIFNLDTIPLPEISELQNTLAPWLRGKQKYCNTVTNDCDENTSSDAEYNNATNSASKTIESSTQCDNIQNIDFFKDTSHNSSQTDVSSVSKSVQCVISSTVKHSQTDIILTKSSAIQCYLQSEQEKTTNNKKDFESQTDLNVCDKSTQFSKNCDNSLRETDNKCPSINIKEESQPLSSLHLSPSKSLSINISSVKNNVFSPLPSFSSPTLLTERNKSENVVVCRHCNQSLNSKVDYNLHKKSHMVCGFCKRKFQSIKRTRWHIRNDCKIKKIADQQPVVKLVKLEMLSIVQEKYSKCVEEFKNFRLNGNCGLRMRSRSTSSVDSVYSCCSLCRNPVSLLHGLKLGVDKAVQTGLVFESGLVGDVVNRNNIAKPHFMKRVGLMSSPKRIKLSHSFTK